MSNLNEKQRNAKWNQAEKFFARSWTHIFYFWKLRQIMLGKTVFDILKKTDQNTPVRIVDLGCGPGTNVFDVFDVSEQFSHAQWFGLDLNQREAAEGAARSKYRSQQRNKRPIHFMSGDIFKLPFADNSIDIFISSEVVEHLPDPLPALQEMQRVLKPAGYAMVTTPNPRNLPETLGYALDKITAGGFKKLYWKGQDEVSAPPLQAEVGFGHVSVHPFPVWRDWFIQVGLPVVQHVRGPMLFGSPFFDKHRFLSGFIILLDPIMDKLPFRFATTTNLGMLCQKKDAK